MILWYDTETFSPVDIKRGLAKYATEVEVIIATWAVDDGPVQAWDMTAGPPPGDLLEAAAFCDQVRAHNAQFDECVTAASHPELSALLAGKWYCTMAQALRHGLPGGLDKLCQVMRVDEGKLDGREFINTFCKLVKGKRNTRHSHPAEWARGLEYAKQDIAAMRAVSKKMPTWNDTPRELALWDLDQRINRRGIAVDVAFAEAAVRATKAEQDRLKAATREATDDMVLAATQRDRLLAYLFVEHGVELPDLKADTIERRLNDPELPEYVKDLLRIRQQSTKSSTAKYKRLLESQVEGRLYYTLQYRGAQRTGRWAGRLFQPHNLPRPTMKFHQVEMAIDAFLTGTETLVLDDIMAAASSSLRSVLVAPPGKKLVIADYKNIEGRKLAWIAGEDWKIQAFRDFDAGHGPDIYVASYAKSFDLEHGEVSKGQRQIGKVQELALGYEGGVGAYAAMAATYRLDLHDLARAALPTFSAEVRKDAEGVYEWAKRKGRTLGLDRDVYVACEGLKRLWREAHPATVQLWADVQNAAVAAVQNPGTAFPAGRLAFDRRGNWLRMRLPSGRYLLYPNPKITWHGERPSLSYASWNVYRKAWCHEPTYGGKLVENACQASAADVMVEGMFAAEPEGYEIDLTVHDELVCETPDSPEFTAARLEQLLSKGADWTAGLPLAAGGYETYRYRKED